MSLNKFRLPLSLLGAFFVLGVFFSPLFQGKVLFQSDTQGWKGMVQEIKTFEEETGTHSYWTGNLFSGMPTITIDNGVKSNFFVYVEKAFSWLPTPIWYLFLTFVGFFLLLHVFHVRFLLAFAGGLAYTFSSYFFIITAVGHVTKMHALAYVAFIISGIILTYRKKYLLGGLLFAIFLSLHIYANHPQITYYLLLMVLLLGIFEFVRAFRSKTLKEFGIGTVVLVLGAILAVGSNAESLYKVYDYAKVSTRGPSILPEEPQKGNGELEYATEWSYGKKESLTLLIPNIKGGASNGMLLDKSSESYAVLKELRVQNPKQILKNLPVYWGTQLFTEGGVYIGALVVFLFIFGLLAYKSHLKWWLFSVFLLALFLSWGRNFMDFYLLFYNYFPLFTKFRTPSMVLVLAEFSAPLLGFLGLQQLLSNPRDLKMRMQMQKYLSISAAFTIGLCLLFYFFPSLSGDFSGIRDAQFPEVLQQALRADRIDLLRSDALRSAFFIFVGFGTLWLYTKNRLKELPLLVALIVLILIDMWGINRRFVNDHNYISKRRFAAAYPYPADQEILKDTALSYRVLDITESPFNSSRASFFHKSIGGYQAAKLRRYQDLITYCLQPELQKLSKGLQAQIPIDTVMQELPCLRMLNLKYLIYNSNSAPLKTNTGLGNAWFVQHLKTVASPQEEIFAVEHTDLKTTAIAISGEEKKFNLQKELGDGSISLVRYQPNQLEYQVKSQTGGLVVFSEIYHPDWRLNYAGKELPILRVNYALMAVSLPKGDGKLVLTFKPEKYDIWRIIAIVSSFVLLLLILFIVFKIVTKKGRIKK